MIAKISFLEEYKCDIQRKKIIPEYINEYLIGGCLKNDNRQINIEKNQHILTHLVAIKSSLYNPVLNTLRRYDIEDVQGKLTYEHSRNTLPPGMTKFPKFDFYKFDPPQVICPGYDLLPLTQHTSHQENIDNELTYYINENMSEPWKKFINNIPLSKTRINVIKNKNIRFHNYVLKYMKKNYEPPQKYLCRRNNY